MNYLLNNQYDIAYNSTSVYDVLSKKKEKIEMY